MERVFIYEMLGKIQLGHEKKCSRAIHPPFTTAMVSKTLSDP